MGSVESVILEATEPAAAHAFTTAAFGVNDRVGARVSDEPSTGFRGFSLSLVVCQPSTVDSLVGTALDRGATTSKPVKKGFWGYGGVVQAPDGTIWKVATSSKKETGPSTRRIDDVVLLLGVDDVKASKRFYVDRGLMVAKSFGGKYVEFESSPSRVTLALLRRDALAKDVGVSTDGTGSHGIVIRSDAGTFTDPDGFSWEAAT